MEKHKEHSKINLDQNLKPNQFSINTQNLNLQLCCSAELKYIVTLAQYDQLEKTGHNYRSQIGEKNFRVYNKINQREFICNNSSVLLRSIF